MNDAFDGLVLAPWDDETLDNLQRYQTLDMTHPYTCRRDHDTPGPRILEPTEAGFICPDEDCGYTQSWAHRMSADAGHILYLRQQGEQVKGWAQTNPCTR